MKSDKDRNLKLLDGAISDLYYLIAAIESECKGRLYKLALRTIARDLIEAKDGFKGDDDGN